ncbi:MAG: YebC/PmpR family DNA-binding transcriptional regulator [Alphaproteobacteria bacterium]|nr:YebC/PmpR family DNA-binding transcriptional regulator [Alphaproteobacteria bacterium]
MAGHSHAANIARRKGAQDIKRGKIFTKIAREMIVAAKGGPDINFNAKLRSVVIKARQAGMAKDRIDAAIAKGSGTGTVEAYETVRYEGYGPGGVAILVDALTDNRNRTAADVRSIFTKNGGNMGESGSVAFMFEHIGLIEYPAEKILEEAMLEAAIDAGAENCETAEGLHSITTTMETMAGVRDALAQRFGDPVTAKLTFVAKVTAPVGAEGTEALMDLVEALEDHDDVQEVFTNADFDEAALQKLSA